MIRPVDIVDLERYPLDRPETLEYEQLIARGCGSQRDRLRGLQKFCQTRGARRDEA